MFEGMQQKRFIVSIIGFLLVLFIAWYFLDQRGAGNGDATSETEKGTTSAPSGVIDASSDPKAIVDKVAKHMLLPKGEIKLAAVTDVESLRKKNPGWFDFAKNGDILLHYAYGIIIYDPAVDKIVDVVRLFNDQKKVEEEPEEKE